MRYLISFLLLGALDTVRADCVASIETRSLDLMSTKTEYDRNTGQPMEKIEIDRIDATIINVDTGDEKFYFNDEWGARVHISHCEAKDGTIITPEWPEHNRLMRRRALDIIANDVQKVITNRRRLESAKRRKLQGPPQCVIDSGCDVGILEGVISTDFCSDIQTFADCVEDAASCDDATMSDVVNPFIDEMVSQFPDGCDGFVGNGDGYGGGDMDMDNYGGDHYGGDHFGGDHDGGDDMDMDNYGGDHFGGDHHGDHEDHDDEGDHYGGDHWDHHRDDDDDECGGPELDPNSGDHHGCEDEPICLHTSDCFHELEKYLIKNHLEGPDCKALQDLDTCVITTPGDPCQGDAEYTEQLAIWKGCTCDNVGCENTQDVSTTIIDPATWDSPFLSNNIFAGSRFVIPGYDEDAFGSFFRYDMGDAMDMHSGTKSSPWDKFAAFPDAKYEWDEAQGRCMPFVKIDGVDDMVMLKSFDGVDMDCALDFAMSEQHVKNEECIASNYENCWVDEWGARGFGHEVHPHGFIRDIRSTIRKASGAAPPSEFDGDETVEFTYLDASGTVQTASTKLTYKKYLKADALAKNRFEKARQTGDKCAQPPKILKPASTTDYLYDGPFDCWSQQCTHTTITQPLTCKRKDASGNDAPRIEKNSRAEMASGIDETLFSFALVTKKVSAINGKKEVFGHLPGMANMKSCKLSIDGLVDKDGVAMCQNINFGPPGSNEIDIKKPNCEYPELMSLADEFSNTLEKMSNGKVSTDASILMPYIGSDAWGSCSFLINQALLFEDKKKEITTKGCPHEWDETEGSPWQVDPCCNWMLGDSMCCSPRVVEVDVPEASVDTDKLAEYCANDVTQLTMAIFASKAFVEAKAESVDPTYGCVGQRQKDLKKYESLGSAAEDCAGEVVGEHQNDGKSKSTKECTTDADCYSGTCKEAEGGGGSSTRTCQTSNLPEHMAACLLDKFSSTPKAAAILKDVTTNGNIKANAYQVGQGLAALAGREMCIGPEGWNYDPEWPTCKYGTDEDGNWFDMWNWETGQCDEYFCQGRDDCKSKCLATNPVCNTDPWNSGITQEQCESDELGGNFCAMCWSGDQDCYEVSEPTVCRIDRHGNQWEGQFTEESCKALMGEKGTVVTQTYEWSGDETTCTLPGVSTQEECVNVDNICEEIGFTDEWGCMTEKDVNDCWGDMPSSARPEYNPISGNETCHCDDINDEWCYCNARWHEHWIEYKKHHWKPMCTWEVKFKTEEEARSFCPEVPGMEVTLISTKEKRCKYEQLCFTKDLELDVTSLYPEWEWDCMNPNWGSTCAQTHLNHGAGDEGWMQLITKDDLDNFKDCVDNNEHDWCTYSDNFEEKFNTIYQCVDTGVCDGTDANACDALRGQASAYQAKFNELGGNQYWPPHVWWQEDLGICRIQFDSWDLGGMTAAAQTCDYYNFTWKSSKFFEAGRFDTEEKCTAGVCDQDPGGWMGLTEEECVQTASCSNWNCLGCERNNWEAPDSVCWIPTTSDGEAMTETLCGHQNYTGTWKEFTGDGQTFHACVKDENQGPENCKFTYAKCDGMKTEQCGGGDGWMSAGAGVFDNAVTQHLLTCQPSAWSECKSKTECEAVGECWGGMRRHYCYNGECGIWTNVCIAPKVADEWGWESCDSYGSWHEGVEWIETGCIILSKSSEADCDEIGGTWTSTEETEETCLATKKCSQSQGWFNNMDETECDKCDNSWESTNQWWGNTWNIGKMRSMYKWKERKYEPKTDWISELDSWRVREVIKEIVNALNEEVEGAFAKCMYSPLIDSLEKIACVCGKDRGSCDIDGIFGAGTSLVNTTAYTGAAETAGKHSGTRVEIGSDSVNTSATVEMTSQIFIPPVSNSTGSSDYGSEASTTLGTSRKLLKNMYRRLTGEEEEESSLNSAGCATVVKNSAGFFVGQMVGDCVTLSISEDGEAGSFVDPARMCINTKSAIERAPEYTIAGVGIAVGTTHYRIKDVGVVEVNGEQFCFDVTEGMEACPIMHAPNPEDAEADVTEGKCGLVEELVTTVVMKQGCKMGDRKSCAWLEEGSLSRAAAMATGVLLLIIIVATLVSSCCGAWLHPKSRAVMLKHLNKEYYNSIDKDGDGLLDKNEIRAMLDKEFGEKISDAELDKLFDQFDHDHNGQLDFEEYKKMMNAHKINGGPSRNMQGGSDK